MFQNHMPVFCIQREKAYANQTDQKFYKCI